MNLINACCLDAMKEIPNDSIDLVLTDPPYSMTGLKWDSVIDIDMMFSELNRITKNNQAIAIFGSEPFSTQLKYKNIKKFKYEWVWNKCRPTGFQYAKHQPMKYHEFIHIFERRGQKVNYYPLMEERAKKITKSQGKLVGEMLRPRFKIDGKKREYTHKMPSSIVKVSAANIRPRLHPSQKPVKLLEYLIKTYTKKGDVVLDFAMGSGSTGIACMNTERIFMGIEKDNKYFRIASERLCLLYTSPSPRDRTRARMPSSA